MGRPDAGRQQDWEVNAQEFLDDIRAGRVTHGVMIYRTKEGEINYRVFDGESGTYVLGLLSRLQFILNAGANIIEEVGGE